MTIEKTEKINVNKDGQEIYWIYYENTHRKKGIKIECDLCGEKSVKQLSNYKRRNTSYCSISCASKQNNKDRDYNGEDNPNYKGKYDYISKLKKDSECEYCGENRSPALQFHHVDGEKIGSISRMAGMKKYSLADIKKEVNKCEIICANCHSIKHSNTLLTQSG